MRTLEIKDEEGVAGAWIAGANIGRLDVLNLMRKARPSEDIGPPLMDENAYVWPDPILEPVIVDFSKAGKGIGINIPTETLQDWI